MLTVNLSKQIPKQMIISKQNALNVTTAGKHSSFVTLMINSKDL